MKRRILLIGVLALVALLGFATAVSAKTIRGEGSITARGIGVAIVHGDGEVEITGQGRGIVHVEGAARLEARGAGFRVDLPGGGAIFSGWRGRIYAAGSELTVWMCGGMLEFTAEGTGWVFMRGRGTYEIDAETYDWSADGARVALGDVEE
jgi:hypothetical protein